MVPVGHPQHCLQIGDEHGIDDRVQPGQVLGPDVDLDSLVRDRELAARRFRIAHHGDGIERVTTLFDRAQDRARRVVAAHPLQAIRDLALPRAVDDDDQVQDPSRRDRDIGGVALA